ncbi:UPF0280 family protein [uncultured Sulfitobacter sp.]|jgi:ApbE superfamily uncharacterized protein (UPF0280 family)|uniref:UPF0280 family protein n=1 Tax=uncultured Sulfitobacter sp. TaxID=191468 RepID=UPI0030D97DFF|tara:strand:- start:67467 stop:68324 length:858 start_codon:yes stop_codon:yes gene_type:complete
MNAQAAILPGDRLHLSHGPIDLIIGCDGARDVAYRAAYARFETALTELMAELPLLRRPVSTKPVGKISRRMYRAALPHADGLTTPMICVAGAVAEEILAAMVDATDLTRAYVNNGGDIALHLTHGATFKIAVASPDGQNLGTVAITSTDPIRGIATSGQRGRSQSLGIADAVTVLARSASMADAAATRLGNAVDLRDHPAIKRVPANSLRDDTDLGSAPVVTHVGRLSQTDVAQALEQGKAAASRMCAAHLIHGAALFLQGQSRTLGLPERMKQIQKDPQKCLTS